MRGLNNLKEYKIIFSDIDGTLLNNENQVPEETIEELRRLDSQGVPFVLVSARMPKGMRPIREELGIHAPMVCYSGGLVLDPDDQEIYSCLLDLDLACEIKSLVAKEFPEVVCGIYGGEHWVVDDIRDPWVIQEQGITHLIPETGDIREIFGKEGGIHKFLFMGDEEAVIRTENRLKERYPQLSIARSKPVYLEVMNGNVCKSAGVKIVCEKYDIPVEQSLAFGDGQNEGQQTLSKKGYDATEVFELREYQPGDSIRTIHWKLSEKFDTVLVREPSDTSSYDILVMFDAGLTSGEVTYEPDVLSGAVSAAAAVSEKLMEHKVPHYLGMWAGNKIYLNQITGQQEYDNTMDTWMNLSLQKERGMGLKSLIAEKSHSNYRRILYFTAGTCPDALSSVPEPDTLH